MRKYILNLPFSLLSYSVESILLIVDKADSGFIRKYSDNGATHTVLSYVFKQLNTRLMLGVVSSPSQKSERKRLLSHNDKTTFFTSLHIIMVSTLINLIGLIVALFWSSIRYSFNFSIDVKVISPPLMI